MFGITIQQLTEPLTRIAVAALGRGMQHRHLISYGMLVMALGRGMQHRHLISYGILVMALGRGMQHRHLMTDQHWAPRETSVGMGT